MQMVIGIVSPHGSRRDEARGATATWVSDRDVDSTLDLLVVGIDVTVERD
ncbi:hypothetical protein ABZZ79_34150 [Streptomyces sp. NPDC006458]